MFTVKISCVTQNLVLTPPFALCSRGAPAQPGRWPAGRSARPYALKPGGIGAAEHAHPGCPRYQATSARAHMPDRVAAADSKFLSGGAMGVLFSLTGATADGRQRRGLGEDNLRCSQLVCCVTRPHPTPSTLHLLGTCGGRRGHCTPLYTTVCPVGPLPCHGCHHIHPGPTRTAHPLLTRYCHPFLCLPCA